MILSKTCRCGTSYSNRAWRRLHLVGHMRDPELLGWGAREVEMRNCAVCKSTISVLHLTWWRRALAMAACIAIAAAASRALHALVRLVLPA